MLFCNVNNDLGKFVGAHCHSRRQANRYNDGGYQKRTGGKRHSCHCRSDPYSNCRLDQGRYRIVHCHDRRGIGDDFQKNRFSRFERGSGLTIVVQFHSPRKSSRQLCGRGRPVYGRVRYGLAPVSVKRFETEILGGLDQPVASLRHN
jgi:hypothetical protein